MISTGNCPLNQLALDSDFTINGYQELLTIAKRRYTFASYNAIPWGQKFVLWRHDCDYSLNRAHALAKIEASEGIQATYFLNPHCEFYNLFENKQHRLVLDIIEMGHKIGLHFDAAFYNTSNEVQLGGQISAEAKLLEGLYGVKPLAFSFHNPVAAHLNCEKEAYGGLVNCYSRRFKAEVPYCSDSNGYWRFRRLKDVLTQATDPCLQVLTHPGWWQEVAMPPRQRIFRSAYGRAAATLRDYDYGLEFHDRLNHIGASKALLFLKKVNLPLFELCDYLWNADCLHTLFLELWRLHGEQIYRLSVAELRKEWKVPAIEINTFFENHNFLVDRSKLFMAVFAKDWRVIASVDESIYQQWSTLRSLLSSSYVSATRQQLEDGCKFLCNAIESLGAWGNGQAINFDGINSLKSIGTQAYRTEDGSLADLLEEAVVNTHSYSRDKWEQLKLVLKNDSLGGTSK